MDGKIIRRQKCGTGFSYKTEQGDTIKDPKLRERLKGLAIPPAWTQVEISADLQADLLATGRDVAGRKQYLYHPNYRLRQEAAKHDRIMRFAERLESMRRTTGQHLRHRRLTREKVLACMVRLLDLAYFRPGNPQYAKENDTYGLTTMRSRHLSIEGDELVFTYRGKSGVEQERHVQDARLAKVVAELDELPGYEIFKYLDENGQRVKVTSYELNEYIREVMGESFSAKDFRTWAGTVIAAVALDELGYSEEPKAADARVRQAVEQVAQKIGNTPTVARSSYIDPRVIQQYLDGRTTSFFRKQVERELESTSGLSLDEIGLLYLLKSRLKGNPQGATRRTGSS